MTDEELDEIDNDLMEVIFNALSKRFTGEELQERFHEAMTQIGETLNTL